MALFKQTNIQTKEIPPLLNPPLLESIFEFRWELKRDPQTDRLRDVAYPMMYGRLYERIKKDFPLIEDLPSVQAHPEATPFVVRHRLRKDKNGWPVLQIGPGIMTLNETAGYSWSSFKALILRLVESVMDLFPEGDFPLNIIKSEIRYINGVPFDIQQEHPLSFLQEKLHVKVEMEKELFEGKMIQEKPLDFGLNMVYPLERPLGNLLIALNLGEVEKKSAYLLQTLIQSFGETAPQEKESFEKWLEEAHQVACHSFQTLCKGALMKKFGESK